MSSDVFTMAEVEFHCGEICVMEMRRITKEAFLSSIEQRNTRATHKKITVNKTQITFLLLNEIINDFFLLP